MMASSFSIDLREGFRTTARWYLAAIFLALVFAASFALASRAKGFDARQVPCGFGDLIANALAGMATFLPSPREPFKFPVSWAITLLLLAYITLGYPYRDLMGFGQKALVACRSRRSWWLSKCSWVVASVCAFWIVFYGVTFLMAVILGGGPSLAVSPQLERVLQWDVPVRYSEPDFVAFILLVPIMTSAICLFQLCISLFLRPAISYLVTFSGLFLAAFYYQLPFLPGNYLMAMRTPGVVGSGFSPLWGLILAVVLGIGSSVAGAYRFSRMDILEGEA